MRIQEGGFCKIEYKTITCFTTLRCFLLQPSARQINSNYQKFMALYNTHICVLIVFEVSCESFAKFLFIIMGYYSVSKLEKCHFQMMAINSISNDGSIKISPQSFNKLYFKTFSVGKLLILIIKIHVLLWFVLLPLFVEYFFSF